MHHYCSIRQVNSISREGKSLAINLFFRHGKDDDAFRGGWSQRGMIEKGFRKATHMHYRSSIAWWPHVIRKITFPSTWNRMRKSEEARASHIFFRPLIFCTLRPGWRGLCLNRFKAAIMAFRSILVSFRALRLNSSEKWILITKEILRRMVFMHSSDLDVLQTSFDAFLPF